MKNVEQTIQKEFANSPSMRRIIACMNSYLDPRASLIAFYNYVWNIDTAVGFGLNIWGRILGVSRVIPLPGDEGSFGFHNADVPPDWENFGSPMSSGGGPFYNGAVTTGSFSLNDTAYRTLLLTKALANITATTAPALNALLQNLFPGRGRAFVRDNHDMTMTYVFNFSLSSIEFAILQFSGVLPHPGGVGVNVQVIPIGFVGFKEANADGQNSVTTWGFGPWYAPSTGT